MKRVLSRLLALLVGFSGLVFSGSVSLAGTVLPVATVALNPLGYAPQLWQTPVGLVFDFSDNPALALCQSQPCTAWFLTDRKTIKVSLSGSRLVLAKPLANNSNEYQLKIYCKKRLLAQGDGPLLLSQDVYWNQLLASLKPLYALRIKAAVESVPEPAPDSVENALQVPPVISTYAGWRVNEQAAASRQDVALALSRYMAMWALMPPAIWQEVSMGYPFGEMRNMGRLPEPAFEWHTGLDWLSMTPTKTPTELTRAQQGVLFQASNRYRPWVLGWSVAYYRAASQPVAASPQASENLFYVLSQGGGGLLPLNLNDDIEALVNQNPQDAWLHQVLTLLVINEQENHPLVQHQTLLQWLDRCIWASSRSEPLETAYLQSLRLWLTDPHSTARSQPFESGYASVVQQFSRPLKPDTSLAAMATRAFVLATLHQSL